MKHIKKLNTQYQIIRKGNSVIIADSLEGDKLLLSIMADLEEKILSFTNELESKLDDMYNSIQLKCSDLFNSISKMPSKETADPDMIFNVIDSLTKIKMDSIDNLDSIFKYIDSSLDETFDDDIDFLHFSSFVAKDCGDVKEAIKIQELTRKRLNQLGEIVHDICSNTEEKVNSQIFSILDLLDHKYEIFNVISGEASLFDSHNSEEYIAVEEDNTTSNSTRIPRTSLELKRHLKKEGFVLHRHNGSHQIYKNEDGEVRLIPARRGNHVLAAKTAKKIYQGTAIAAAN